MGSVKSGAIHPELRRRRRMEQLSRPLAILAVLSTGAVRRSVLGQRAPFVEGTSPPARSSICVAQSSALASALKQASTR